MAFAYQLVRVRTERDLTGKCLMTRRARIMTRDLVTGSFLTIGSFSVTRISTAQTFSVTEAPCNSKILEV